MTQALLSQLPSSTVLQQPLLDRSQLASQLLASLSQQSGQMPIVIGESRSGRTIFLSQLAKLWQQYRPEEQVLRLDFAELAKQSKQGASAGLMSTVMALKSDQSKKVVCCDALEALAHSVELGWLVQWAVDELQQAPQLKLVLVMTEALYQSRFADQLAFQLEPASASQTAFLLKSYLKQNEAAQWLNLAPDFVEKLMAAAGLLVERALPGAAFDLIALILRDCAAKGGVIGGNEVDLAVEQLVGASAELPAQAIGRVKQLQQLIDILPAYADEIECLINFSQQDPLSRPLLACLSGEQEVSLFELVKGLQQSLCSDPHDVVQMSFESAMAVEQLKQMLAASPSLVVITDLHLADEAQLEQLFKSLEKESVKALLARTLVIGVFVESVVSTASQALLQLVVTDMPQPVASLPKTIENVLPEWCLTEVCSIRVG